MNSIWVRGESGPREGKGKVPIKKNSSGLRSDSMREGQESRVHVSPRGSTKEKETQGRKVHKRREIEQSIQGGCPAESERTIRSLKKGGTVEWRYFSHSSREKDTNAKK